MSAPKITAPQISRQFSLLRKLASTDACVPVIALKQIGISTEQALREAGYGEVDVKRMLQKPARQ